MRQVVQPVHGGGPRVVDVPAPAVRPGGVLVRTAWSLVSAGTERMVVGLAGKSLAGKARSRPEQVAKVLGKLRTDGLRSTWEAVRAKLDSEIPLGYSAAGEVLEVGGDVEDLSPGDRVACAGMGHASHAEVLSVPRNLVARVPKGLDLRAACTATVGAIALQGVRRAEVTLGERVGVVGLGLIGLLTVQMLRAAGCHVLAVDLDPERVRLAGALGAELALHRGAGDLPAKAATFGAGRGLDAVIVCASTSSNDPCLLAAEMCRLGGRVVVVGAVGMDLPRRVLYDKELDVRLARSYGPGRYDPAYEEAGVDYPYEWVRFTEGRNLEEYLALLGRGEVDVEPLLDREYGIEEGERAYRFLTSERAGSAVGLLFRYGDRGSVPAGRVALRGRRALPDGVGVALVGAGAFARGVLLPALAKVPGARPTGIVSPGGLSAASAGRRFDFRYAATRLEEVLEDPETDAVIVATRHGEHARIVTAALRAGKEVFVEKPLALTLAELSALNETVAETGRILMVGFNRRFAPTYRRLRDRFEGRAGPLQMVYRVDAGALPREHWTRDPVEGGGRIRGEACHFVDLLLDLAGAPVTRVHAERLPEDGMTATLRFADGSVGTVIYAVAGDPALGKERLEVFGDGTTAVLENFRRLRVATGGRARCLRAAGGKGHREEVRAFVGAVARGGSSPVPYEQAAWSTRATLALLESAATGAAVRLGRGA